MRTEPCDGDVPGDPSVPVEELGVNHAAHRPVDEVARDPLQQRQRSGTVQLDLAEGGHIDDAHSFAEGAVLLGLQVEPWWSNPAEAALVRARPAPGAARLKVLGPLPAMLGPEDRAQ